MGGVVHTSSCLCGGMRLKIMGEPMFRVLCHCKICQKLTGSVAHNLAFKPDQVHVEKKSVPWIEYKTSEKLTRHSCSTCAVTMMNVLEGEKACVAIPAGSIDREGGPNDAFFLPQHQIYFGDRICDTPADVPKWSGFMGSSEKLA